MHFHPAAAVRFRGDFNGPIDKLHAGSDGNIIEKVFDVVIPQTNTALAHPQPDAEIGVCAVYGIEPADIDCIQPHRVIRPGGHEGRQRFSLCRIGTARFGRRRPSGSHLLTFNRRYPVTRGFAPGLTDADGQHFNGIAARRVIVETHFRHVNDNPLANGVGQNQLLGNDQPGAGFGQKRIHARVRFQHIAQPLPVLRGKRLKR